MFRILILILTFCSFTGVAAAQTVLVDPTNEGGFEVNTGWSAANDGTNRWRIRSNFKCSGSKGAYIGTGNNNNNYNKTSSQVSHVYRDITFPAGETDIQLTFDYKCGGESTYDGMKIYLVATSTTPSAGTALSTGQIGNTWYNLQGTCSGTSITIDGSNAGTTKRLVFSWINDASGGSNPAVLLDNVSVVSQVPVATCSDGIQNQGETGVDCGGPCPVCVTQHTMGTGDITLCAADVYDSGNSGSNYGSSESYTETYCSDNSDCLSLTFTSFSTESCCDELTIYDGPNTSSPVIGTYAGSTLPNGGTVGSSSGCLTLQWSSDGSVTDAGWEASISCGTCPTCSDGIQNGSETGVDCGGSCPTSCPCEDITIASLPYSTTGNNTSSYGDDYSSSDACGSSYLNGDDIVYKYDCSSDECIDITLSNTGSYVGLFLMDGCPDDVGTSCVASTTASGGNPSLSGVSLTGGNSYYIVISTWPSPQSTAFDINVTSSPINPAFTPITCAAAMGTGVISVGSLPYTSGAGTTCGAADDLTTSNTVTCGSTSYSGDEDQVFVFTPATTGSVTISLTSADTYTALSLYDGCPVIASCTPVSGTCIRSEKSSTTSKSITECLTGGVTYYLVLDSWNGSNCISYSDLTISAPSGGGSPANDNPCTATALSVGASCTWTTFDNSCATASGIADPGCASYTNRDLWFKVTVPASGNLVIDTDEGVITDGGMALYTGTCGSLTLVECDDSDSNNGSMPRICRSGAGVGDCSGFACGGALTPGSEVFIRMWEDGGNNNGSFQICAYEPVAPAAPANDDPCNATALTVGTSCSYGTYTNDCATASTGVPAPGCAGYSGADVWFSAIVPASGSMAINTNTGVITDGGMALYTGSCSSLTLVECDDNDSDNGSMPYLQSNALTAGTTVYIRMWEDGNNNNGTFDICVWDPCPGGASANDLPCNAQALSLGIAASGDNSCSNDLSEPSTPTCWTTGTRNTIWYSVTAPASGELSVKAVTGGLTDTQIALYSGSCGSLTEVACNDNYSSCGTTVYGSEIVATGLTSGNTYWVAVDGAYDLTGTFSIIAIDGTTTYPVVPGQDCSVSQAIQACNEIMTVGNPGYAGTGNSCNFDGTGNCTSGEKNSVWYLIDISTTGTMEFTLVPNDWASGSCGPETDYDFLIWRVAGAGTTTDCAGILADPSTGLVGCNFSYLGVTGLGASGNAPATYGSCFDAAFETGVAVTAGDQYLLAVQNYSGSTQGFTLDFTYTNTGIINYNSPTTLTWTGGSTDEWSSSTNWGSCTEPDCGINALVIAGPSNQPVISDSVHCQDLTINPGAVVTLQAGAVLEICGNLENNGTISADPGAIILFNNGSTTQEITGSFSGNNKLGTVMIDKTGGEVAIGQDVEIGGDLITMSVTSVFNTNGHKVTLGGNLDVNNNNATYAGVGSTGTLEFNGDALQAVSTNGTIVLNNITLNNSGAGVQLNNKVNVSGHLTLTQGVMHTTASNLLNLQNTATSDEGNNSSFVDGPIQKAGNSAFVFPTGDGSVWARIAMSAPTGSGSSAFRAEYFDGAHSNTGSINTMTLINVSTVEYWQFDRINGTRSTELTLYWEDGARSGISDLADLVVAHYTAGQWESETNSGGTTGNTTAGTVTSQSIGSFSPITFGSNTNSENPLPIELVSFRGVKTMLGHELIWKTVAEINNDYFILERSTDLENWEALEKVDGAGTHTGTLVYSHLDRNPIEGENYYRLQQVDFDGTSTWSNTVMLEREAPKLVGQVYPNPVESDLTLEFRTGHETEYTLSIVDHSGRTVREQYLSAVTGFNLVQLTTHDLAAGVYAIKLTDPSTGEVLRERFAKQ